MGLAEIWKSTKVTITLTEWVREPPVPVIVMEYVSGGMEAIVVIVRVDVPVEPRVKLTLVGSNVAVGPVVEGETDAVRLTLPVKPRLFRVIVEVAEPPAMKLLGLAGVAEMVKSGVTVTVTVAEWDGTPVPEPVTVTT